MDGGVSGLLYSIPRSPIFSVLFPVALGSASGIITKSSVETWYVTQRKPPGEPPRAAFPIVWTTLYAGMGYASHLFVKTLDKSPSRLARAHAKQALQLHWLQLGLNMPLKLWTPLFFGIHKPALALVDIVGLWVSVFKLTNVAFRLDTKAGCIHLAYLAWVSYATYLNAGVFYLNRDSSTSKRS